MTPGPGIEPGTHWWKASALTTTPTLLPVLYNKMLKPTKRLRDQEILNHNLLLLLFLINHDFLAVMLFQEFR